MDDRASINSLRKCKLMGYDLLDEPVPALLSLPDSVIINTLNPHSWVCATSDPDFRYALDKSDLIIADGVGLFIASIILNGSAIYRTTGADLWKSLMEELNKKMGRCFYLGSTPEVLNKIRDHINNHFQSVTFGCYSPPFCEDFTQDQIDEMVESINEFKPDVLFIGITAPRQEKLAQKLRGRINPKVTASIGAVFDFVAGSQPRAPNVMRNLGLEWLYRLIREPKRMWRRNFISTPRFLYAVFSYRFFREK